MLRVQKFPFGYLKDFSKISEIPSPVLSRIETGKTNPSVKRLESIAKALDIPVSEIMKKAEFLDSQTPESTGSGCQAGFCTD